MTAYVQRLAPQPHIKCRPGWCLEYVNNAFGVPEVYNSATDAWNGSATKHRDRAFPPGVALPVHYGLHGNPLGHIVLRMADGSVYSTSDLTDTPHHHPDLADLEAYYAYYGIPLTYRGWTEDVEGTPVIVPAGGAALGPQGTINKKEWYDMTIPRNDLLAIAAAVNNNKFREDIRDEILTTPIRSTDGKKWPLSAHIQGNTARTVEALARIAGLEELVKQTAAGAGTVIDYAKVEAAAAAGAQKALAEAQAVDAEAIADAVADDFADRLGGGR